MELLTIGDNAPDSLVTDIEGQSIHLAELWQDGPTLLVFLRHFGCIFCRERLSQLAQHQTDIEQAGLKIVAIGIGEAKHADRYCGNLLPNATCLASEDAAIYHTYGFAQVKLGDMLSFQAVKNSVRAFTSGQMQGQTTGDFRMIGGTFIVDTDGVIQYAYYSKTPGDHPSFGVVLETAQEIFS